jgi:hypothetical protein
MKLTSIVKAIMIAVGFFASLSITFAAVDHTNALVFVGDYDGESTVYTGAIQTNGTWRPIGFENDSLNRYEDDMQTDSNSTAVVDLYTDGTLKFNHNDKTFSFWYLATDGMITGVTHNQNVTEAYVNGRLAQVGDVTQNGAITLLRDAGDPFTCTFTCGGYFTQQGSLIRFVYTVVENEPTHPYSVFIPMASR